MHKANRLNVGAKTRHGNLRIPDPMLPGVSISTAFWRPQLRRVLILYYILFPNICGIYIVWQPRNFWVTIHSASEDRTHGNGPELLKLSKSCWVGGRSSRESAQMQLAHQVKARVKCGATKIECMVCSVPYLCISLFAMWIWWMRYFGPHFQVIPRKFKWRNRGCQPSPCQSCHCICSPSTYQHFQKSIVQPGTIQKPWYKHQINDIGHSRQVSRVKQLDWIDWTLSLNNDMVHFIWLTCSFQHTATRNWWGTH